METEQVTVCLHQGGMHLMVKTSKEVLEKMEEIRKQNPEQWEMKDIKLMKQAKRVSLELDKKQVETLRDKLQLNCEI